MKKFILLTQLVSLLCTTTIAMENNNYQFQQATDKHAQQIVDIINNHAFADNTKIAIFPKKFREPDIQDNIKKGRLYCAANKADEVIAFKKLFIINDEQEYNKRTTNEIRCTGNNNCHVRTQVFNADHSNLDTIPTVPFSFTNSVIIYCGSDYTLPAYRNQRINSELTNYAFNAIKNDTLNAIKKNNFDNIVLLYGLTKDNAGEQGGIDRTPSIVRAFRRFVERVSMQALNKPATTNTMILHSQYEATMPLFDPESNECIPCTTIGKYGNVLIFPLK
jgi:hypothetical protein